MATDTARAPRAKPDPTRNLWQVPTFLTGVAVFACAWQGIIPLGAPTAAAALRRDVASLRTAAEKRNPDAPELTSLVHKVASAADFAEAKDANAFAVGSGYVRLAELAADPAAAKQNWTLALQHLTAVNAAALPAADADKLAFRAAKAKAAALPPTAPPTELAAVLADLFKQPPGEESGEAPRLVAELCLRSVPPDVKRAKESLAAYLSDANFTVPTASLARAKLRLSEIHLADKETDHARKWLREIPADAPADVLAPAKAQLARIFMTEKDYASAAREWEQVRASPGLSPDLKASSAYYLAVCRNESRDPAAAGKLFEEAAAAAGPEAVAAAVKLVEVRLKAADPKVRASAVDLLARATKDGVDPRAGGWANPLVELNEARGAFEQTIRALRTDGAFEPALKAADLFGAVAMPNQDREKRAEVLAAWGESLKKASGDFRPKFAAAAAEYAALAAAAERAKQPAAQAEFLKRAAGQFRQADKLADATAALEKMLKLPQLSDTVVGPAWTDLVEVKLQTDPAGAKDAIQAAMAGSPAAATAVRYKLARALIDGADPRDPAKKAKAEFGWALLEQIAGATATDPRDREVREKALSELGHERLKAGNYTDAEAHLRKLLNEYPTGPEAGLGKFLLGVCLVQQATAAADTPKAAERRKEALDLFEGLHKELSGRAKAGSAAERDGWLRTQAGLRVLQVYQLQGKPDDVIYNSALMLAEYQGRVEELIILSMMYHAHKMSNRPELALAELERMKGVFDKLPPDAFPGGTGEYSRSYWQTTWFAPPAESEKPKGP